MFDYVTREKYETEHELRLKAESSLERANSQIADLFETNAELLKMLEAERQRHADALQNTLDRFAPIPNDPMPGFGVPGSSQLSYEEIMRLPAIGKRGVRERNAAALDAKQREETENQENDAESRRAVLTPDEAAVVDQQITR